MVQETAPSNKFQNIIVAAVAILLAVALFFGQKLQQGSNSLDAQAAAAIPIDIAITSGKPTLMEFYADWCSSCQAMAPNLAKIKQDYGGKVEFAMLNVDNTKWLPEIEKYRVDGIPHFVFFNQRGQTLGEVIGEQPESVMRSTLDEILADHIQPSTDLTSKAIELSVGPTSPMAAEPVAKPTDPRSHSAQASLAS
jgi:thioredoxin-like negative regulator of GroEL